MTVYQSIKQGIVGFQWGVCGWLLSIARTDRGADRGGGGGGGEGGGGRGWAVVSKNKWAPLVSISPPALRLILGDILL